MQTFEELKKIAIQKRSEEKESDIVLRIGDVLREIERQNEKLKYLNEEYENFKNSQGE